MYEYSAKITDVYDGDSITAIVDLGFELFTIKKLRLAGIDTPELKSSMMLEKELARQARDYLKGLVLNKDVRIVTYKKGKYGRYLADVYISEQKVNDMLIARGYARKYDGGKRLPWP